MVRPERGLANGQRLAGGSFAGSGASGRMSETTEVVQKCSQRRMVGVALDDERCVGSPVELRRLVESAACLEQHPEVVLYARDGRMAPRKTALGHRQRATVHALGADDVTGSGLAGPEPDENLDVSQTAQAGHDASSRSRLSL